MILTLVFISGVAGFLLADFIAWRLGVETMSQYLIRQAKASKVFKRLLISIVVIVPILLLVHWELL